MGEKVEPGIVGQVKGYRGGVFLCNGIDEQGGAVEELVLDGESVGIGRVVHPVLLLGVLPTGKALKVREKCNINAEAPASTHCEGLHAHMLPFLLSPQPLGN
jgi:hypothetical protein